MSLVLRIRGKESPHLHYNTTLNSNSSCTTYVPLTLNRLSNKIMYDCLCNTVFWFNQHFPLHYKTNHLTLFVIFQVTFQESGSANKAFATSEIVLYMKL